MTFGHPYLLLALLALPLVAALYVRCAGRREMPVPSLALWKTAAVEAAAETGKRLGALDWPLALALLFLAVTIFAASDPVVSVASFEAPNILLVIDRSASMATRTESGKTRLEQGAEAVRELLGRLGEGRVQLIGLPLAAGPSLKDQSTGEARDLLRRVEPTDMPLDMAREIERCTGIARGASAVVVITDDARPVPERIAGRPVVCFAYGGPSKNVAIDAFEVSIDEKALAVPRPEPVGWSVFVAVKNYSDRAMTVPVHILGTPHASLQAPDTQTERAGASTPATSSTPSTPSTQVPPPPGRPSEHPSTLRPFDPSTLRLFDSSTLRLGPGERATFLSDKPPLDEQWIEVVLDVKDDLRSDDRAIALLSRGAQLRVAYVGRGNPFVLKALELLPGVEVAQFRLAGDVRGRFDLYVYDAVTPEKLPAGEGDVVLIDPVGAVGPVSVRGAVTSEAGLRASVVKDSPLLSNIDAGALRFKRAIKVSAAQGQVLLAAGEGTALMRWEDATRQVTVIGCGLVLNETNWPLLPSFPIFWANVIADSAGRRAADPPTFSLTGEQIVVRQSADAKLSASGPGGEVPLIAGWGARSYLLPTVAGVYTVSGGSAAHRYAHRYAVNMMHPAESNNAGTSSRPTPELERTLLAPGERAGLPLWRHLSIAALVIAMVYWSLAARSNR